MLVPASRFLILVLTAKLADTGPGTSWLPQSAGVHGDGSHSFFTAVANTPQA